MWFWTLFKHNPTRESPCWALLIAYLFCFENESLLLPIRTMAPSWQSTGSLLSLFCEIHYFGQRCCLFFSSHFHQSLWLIIWFVVMSGWLPLFCHAFVLVAKWHNDLTLFCHVYVSICLFCLSVQILQMLEKMVVVQGEVRYYRIDFNVDNKSSNHLFSFSSGNNGRCFVRVQEESDSAILR